MANHSGSLPRLGSGTPDLVEKETHLGVLNESPRRPSSSLSASTRTSYSTGITGEEEASPSRILAKRESLQSLGSIGPLQEFFARQGIAASERPTTRGAGGFALGPAAAASLEATTPDVKSGSPAARRSASEASTSSFAPSAIPASTWKGKSIRDTPKPAEADLSRLWPLMIHALAQTCYDWELPQAITAVPLPEADDSVIPEDLINSTTKTIRAVRNFFFAVPPTALDASSRASTATPTRTLRRKSSMQFREEDVDIVKPKNAFKRSSMISKTTSPESMLQKMAAAGKDDSPGRSTPTKMAPPSSFVPFETMQDRRKSTMLSSPSPMTRRAASESGGERLVAGVVAAAESPHQSEQREEEDPLVSLRSCALGVLSMLQSLQDEPVPGEGVEDKQQVVAEYLAKVDSLLGMLVKSQHLRKYIDATDTARPGSASSEPSVKQPSTSTGDKIKSKDSIPTWAQPSFHGTDLQRTFHLLRDILPEQSRSLPNPNISSSGPRILLDSLSDGYVLCHAFNAALRRSYRAWGFIPSSNIHDLTVSGSAVVHKSNPEEAPSDIKLRPPGWTFRRVENLNRFAAAVTLRYGMRLLPLPPSSSPNGMTRAATDRGKKPVEGLPFDAAMVVRKDPGWEAILEGLVVAWVGSVVQEEQSD